MGLPCRTLLTKISFGWKKKSHEAKEWFLRTEVGGLPPAVEKSTSAGFPYCRRLTLRLASNSWSAVGAKASSSVRRSGFSLAMGTETGGSRGRAARFRCCCQAFPLARQ